MSIQSFCFRLERKASEIFSIYCSSKTHLALCLLVRWQESGEGSLDGVGTAADGVTRVAVVRTLSMEANVVRWRDEKCLQQIIVRQLINLRGDVQNATSHRHRTTKAKQSWLIGRRGRSKKECKLIQSVSGISQQIVMHAERESLKWSNHIDCTAANSLASELLLLGSGQIINCETVGKSAFRHFVTNNSVGPVVSQNSQSQIIIISPVEVKCRNLGVMSLKVGEVEVIGKRLLLTRKPENGRWRSKRRSQKIALNCPGRDFSHHFRRLNHPGKQKRESESLSRLNK